MKSNNFLRICLSLIALSLIAIYIFKLSLSNLPTYVIFLVCPLMHFWMMKDMHHDHSNEDEKECH